MPGIFLKHDGELIKTIVGKLLTSWQLINSASNCILFMSGTVSMSYN